MKRGMSFAELIRQDVLDLDAAEVWPKLAVLWAANLPLGFPEARPRYE